MRDATSPWKPSINAYDIIARRFSPKFRPLNPARERNPEKRDNLYFLSASLNEIARLIAISEAGRLRSPRWGIARNDFGRFGDSFWKKVKENAASQPPAAFPDSEC
jgi:hypothetical protein